LLIDHFIGGDKNEIKNLKKEVFAKDFAMRRLHKIVFPEVFLVGTLWLFMKKQYAHQYAQWEY